MLPMTTLGSFIRDGNGTGAVEGTNWNTRESMRPFTQHGAVDGTIYQCV